ncbi:hypothetical protein ABVK25_012432 [Lepraria finkii]|uniref:Uncharacterized protein n=1 Tax=Lepraria finkii TaxID=1340010 RepID=A0ABR4AEF2_9LECA
MREARIGDEAAVADIHVRAWQEAYRGLIPDEFLDALDPDDRARTYTFGRGPPKPTAFRRGAGGRRGRLVSRPSRGRATYKCPDHGGSCLTVDRPRCEEAGWVIVDNRARRAVSGSRGPLWVGDAMAVRFVGRLDAAAVEQPRIVATIAASRRW